MVLVNEIVAMEHVHTLPRGISRDDPNNFAGRNPNDILHASCLIWHDCIPTTGTREDLEVDQMNVDRVRSVSAAVSQFPDLVLAQDRSCQDAVLDVCPAHSVDDPFALDAGESEVLGDFGFWWGRDVVEIFWQRSVVVKVNERVQNDKSHNAVCGGVIEIACHSAIVEHGDVLAVVVGEIDDNFVTLAFGNCELARSHRVVEKAWGGMVSEVLRMSWKNIPPSEPMTSKSIVLLIPSCCKEITKANH